MAGIHGNRGFTLTELLVATSVLALVLAAVFGVVVQGNGLSARTNSRATIQGNVRLAMERLERDLRMIGFGVPDGAEIGTSTLWAPGIFHASATEIGFRADADGGRASITCTPKATNLSCPLTELLLDSILYYQALGCKQPDNAALNLPIVVVRNRETWQASTCTGVNTGTRSIDVTAVANNRFAAGRSDVLTIEQVYYRYVAGSQPPYGRIERYVRYANRPDSAFPPTVVTWTPVAEHLTDFSLEYRDAGGAVLSGSPLSAAQRGQVRSIAVLIEGFDSVGPQGGNQILQAESEVLVRNAGL